MEMLDEASEMRMFPLPSSLPLCDSVVVLDERPPAKGNGLGLSCRLLIDGCKGRGGGERERMRSHQSITARVQLSEPKAMECEEMGQGERGVGFFFALINVKGTTGQTHKVNGEGSK